MPFWATTRSECGAKAHGSVLRQARDFGLFIRLRDHADEETNRLQNFDGAPDGPRPEPAERSRRIWLASLP